MGGGFQMFDAPPDRGNIFKRDKPGYIELKQLPHSSPVPDMVFRETIFHCRAQIAFASKVIIKMCLL